MRSFLFNNKIKYNRSPALHSLPYSLDKDIANRGALVYLRGVRMAWIEVHQAVFTHRKTLLLADILEMPEVHVAGHLIALWAWSLDNAQDGALHVRNTIIARASMWSGHVQTWVDALCESGYLDRGNDGVLYIHDWDDYAGRLLEKRRANAERMRNSRSKPEQKERATHVQRTLRARAGATVPNRTVPNSTINTPPDNRAEFIERCWMLYPVNNEGRRPGSKKKFADQLQKLSAASWDDFEKAVKHYATSENVKKGYVKTPELWVRDEVWKEYVKPPSPNGNGAHPPDWPPEGYSFEKDEFGEWIHRYPIDRPFPYGAKSEAEVDILHEQAKEQFIADRRKHKEAHV